MPGEIFNEIKIDNQLDANERIAIDKLKFIDTEALKTALTSESIQVKDKEKKISLTFSQIADAFTTYHVSFSKETSNNNLTEEEIIKAKCDNASPERLKHLINDPDKNDFAYFLSVVSHTLAPSKEQTAEIDTFGLETMQQLQDLKAKITVSPATPAIVTTPKE